MLLTLKGDRVRERVQSSIHLWESPFFRRQAALLLSNKAMEGSCSLPAENNNITMMNKVGVVSYNITMMIRWEWSLIT